jgi:hypothetical protein
MPGLFTFVRSLSSLLNDRNTTIVASLELSQDYEFHQLGPMKTHYVGTNIYRASIAITLLNGTSKLSVNGCVCVSVKTLIGEVEATDETLLEGITTDSNVAVASYL